MTTQGWIKLSAKLTHHFTEQSLVEGPQNSAHGAEVAPLLRISWLYHRHLEKAELDQLCQPVEVNVGTPACTTTVTLSIIGGD